MARFAITLGDAPLDLDMLDACLSQPLNVNLADAGLARAERARGWVDRLVERGDAVYGINTGFGHLKNKRISSDQLEQLQENLLISHACGVGAQTPRDVVRWMLLFKTHMLLLGHSGVRVEVIRRLAEWLNADLIPVVPSRGSLGASGDLAPLAHMCLPLIGRGSMQAPGSDAIRPAAELLREHKLQPMSLAAKEGLALTNGTQFMASYAAHIAVRSRRLADLADLSTCMSLEALRGSVGPADQRLHELRPHPGAQTVAANIRAHMADSEVLASHEHCDKVQDPYSLRCAPQVHGAFRDALDHFTQVLSREINSVTDNPILFGDDAGSAQAISGGNFHGEPLALILDYLAMALTDLASIAERRIYLLLSGSDGLPTLLMRDTGVNSGFMLPQYTAAALVNECKVLASPACTDSIPTSLGQEDHVSMGATSALKCYEILDRSETVAAIELMCAAQAMDYRDPLEPGIGPRRAREVVRKEIPHAEHDRQFGEDIERALKLLRGSEELRRVARHEY